jgi:hypothetical protein
MSPHSLIILIAVAFAQIAHKAQFQALAAAARKSRTRHLTKDNNIVNGASEFASDATAVGMCAS